MKFLVAFLGFLFTNISLAQEAAKGYMDTAYITNPGLWDRFTAVAPDWLIVGVPFIIAVLLVCRGLSEALLVIKDKTETTIDNKIFSVVNMVANVMGKGIGYIGLGMPKKMVVEKASKITENKKEG